MITAEGVTSGDEAFSQNAVDLVILDIGLPDGSGMDLCKTIRKKSTVPIIMLTANNSELDEVSGFLAGADDYITKPFSLSILRARVAVIFRRSDHKKQDIVVGRYRLDTNLCTFYKDQIEISISATEYKLLFYMMTNAGQVLSKEQILYALWDKTGNFVDDNTLPVNISRLRAKIEEDPKTPQILKTVYGIGYIWNKERI